MYQTIAVGSDGSDTASIAVDAAIDLAAKYGARLLIIGAHEASVGTSVLAASAGVAVPADPGTEHELDEEVAVGLHPLVERAAQSGVSAEIVAGSGPPGEVLVEVADSHGADLLVVGSKGMKRRVLGSVPNTVTHKASCSVLVVKTD